jgi:hypothetical protein
VRPEWHGDPQVRNWDDITAEIDRQALMKANKTWDDVAIG